MPKLALAVSVMLVVLGSRPLPAQEHRPIAVSPGDPSDIVAIEGSCPTFSWGAMEGASQYELVVYRAEEAAPDTAPAMRKQIPGLALSWTPSASECLTVGGAYAWSVRAVSTGGSSAWSEASLFRIATAPSLAEVEQALGVLRRHLETAEATVTTSEAVALPTPAAGENSEVSAAQRRAEDSRDRDVRSRPLRGSSMGMRRPGEEGRPQGPRLSAPDPATEGRALVADNNIELGANANVFKDGEVLLWTTPDGITAFGTKALSNQTVDERNTAVGARALEDSTTGYDNTAVGHQALGENDSGFSNTAIGRGALRLSYGSGNTAVGANASYYLQTGNNNTAVGIRALEENGAGSTNTAVGAFSMASGYSGSSNTAVGVNALYENNGDSNTAVGFSTLENNDSGVENTAIGLESLRENATGSGNVAAGASALLLNLGGDNNAAFGKIALRNNTSGDRNTALGYKTLYSNVDGARNLAAGVYSLLSNTSGSRNTGVGIGALHNNTSGSRNVGLGNRAGYQTTTGDDNIFISNQGVAGETNQIKIGTQGTQKDTFIAGIWDNPEPGTRYVEVTSSGQLVDGATVTSSRRFKSDIVDMGLASTGLFDLRPVTFEFAGDLAAGEPGRQFGLIAEEVAEIFPELVRRDDQGKIYSVKYRDFSALLINEMQRQRRRGRLLTVGLFATALATAFGFVRRSTVQAR